MGQKLNQKKAFEFVPYTASHSYSLALHRGQASIVGAIYNTHQIPAGNNTRKMKLTELRAAFVLLLAAFVTMATSQDALIMGSREPEEKVKRPCEQRQQQRPQPGSGPTTRR